ncbi:Uncharacterised protein [Enterobacter cloacae]|nr:Uncharacterised protein [Enterobacter cloacae]
MKLHNNNMNQRDIIDLVDQLFEIDRSKRSIIVGAVDGHNHVPQIRIRDVLKVAAGGRAFMKLHNNNMNQRDIIDLIDQLFKIDR